MPPAKNPEHYRAEIRQLKRDNITSHTRLNSERALCKKKLQQAHLEHGIEIAARETAEKLLEAANVYANEKNEQNKKHMTTIAQLKERSDELLVEARNGRAKSEVLLDAFERLGRGLADR